MKGISDRLQIMAGNLRAMEIHMDAVEKMVWLRGGLTALGLNSIIHMMVSWSVPSIAVLA